MLDEKKTILWKSEMLSYVRGNTCRKIKEKREIDINDQMKLPKPKRKQLDLTDFLNYLLVHLLYFVDHLAT